MARIRFNFDLKKFIVQTIQFFLAVALCVYASPYIGVFVAMIQFEVA